tara:strand:- start:323 stop:535 length:213 start_codon:yes stop_codon:yes gene_type:complete
MVKKMNNKNEVTMLWGEEACHVQKGEIGYSEITYSFKSKEELEAFMFGINETCGWLECDTKKYIVNGKEL